MLKCLDLTHQKELTDAEFSQGQFISICQRCAIYQEYGDTDKTIAEILKKTKKAPICNFESVAGKLSKTKQPNPINVSVADCEDLMHTVV